jgi:drug/metabolite transporter (DMT)-like permease
MHSPSSNLRGIALMVLSTGVFACNDAMLKLATQGLPPFQVLFLRGISASLWCLPLVLLAGNFSKLPLIFNKWVLLRNSFEFIAVLCFIFGLANMPIADITALGQISPMLLLLGISLVYGEKIGALRMALIALGFIGALLVAQPGGSGLSIYAVLGFASALAVAARDIVGRRIPGSIPAPVVTFCTLLLVAFGSGVATFAFESWQMPSLRHILLLGGAGLFLAGGHFLIFLAYRVGATAAVAPFYYMFTVWAVISGIVVFGTFPNSLAVAGIALILASGVAVVLLDERRRRLTVIA